MLWLWHRPAAVAAIRPLAGKPPYAAGAALEKAKRQKQKTKNKSKQTNKQKKQIKDGLQRKRNSSQAGIVKEGYVLRATLSWEGSWRTPPTENSGCHLHNH